MEAFGCLIDMEDLGDGYWNIYCTIEDVDEIGEFLDTLNIEWKYV